MRDRNLDVVTPTPDLVIVPFGDGVAVYDPLNEQTTLLDSLAAWLVTIDEPTSIDELVRQAAAEFDGDVSAKANPEVLQAAVVRCATDLQERGLLNRAEIPVTPALPVTGSTSEYGHQHHSSMHHLLDRRVVFRCTTTQAATDIDTLVGCMISPDQADQAALSITDYVDVELRDDGHIIVDANHLWDFPDWASFTNQIHMIVGDYPTAAESMLCLHGGAVRTPSGIVIGIAGLADSGKSTLVAALVAAGCDYLGDEHLGILPGTLTVVGCPKPLRLDDASCHVLGIEPGANKTIDPTRLRPDVTKLCGPIAALDLMVIPQFDPNASLQVDRLDPTKALHAMAGLAFNLGRVPEVAMTVTTQMAQHVAFDHITHGDVDQVVDFLLAR